MTTAEWVDFGRRIGAPGVDAMRKDPGVGKALAASAVVALLWAQGGWSRKLAGVFLLVAIATPGPDGKSLLRVAADQLQGMLHIWSA